MPTAPLRRPPRLAVIVSRFPKISETFQLREIVTLESMGVPVELFAITHEHEGQIHDSARSLDARAHYLPRVNLEILAAQLYWLRRSPQAWIDCWKWALRSFRHAPDFMVRSLVIIPLAATWARRMERLGIEHMHAHYATYPTHAALVIHRLTGITYSFTGHAHDLRVRIDGLGDKIAESEYFVTCTAFSMDNLRELFGDVIIEKGNVSYHGVELDTFAPPVPDPRPPGPRPFRMVCVATFEECKGHRYLLDAVRLLKDRGLEFHLDLVGGNKSNGFDYRQIMIDYAAEVGVTDLVTFHGQQTSVEVRERIGMADFGIIACCRTPEGTMDGLPNFLVECLAMGRPAVTTDLPGPQELVTHEATGLIARTRDAVSLADAAERLALDHDLRDRLGIEGRKLVEREHDLVANTEYLYDLLVERVGRPA